MPTNTITALNDLDNQFGEAEFLVDQDGNAVHVETVFTVKLHGKDPRTWFEEAKRDGTWQPGDRVRVPHHGKYDIVRIIRPARAA